MKGRWEILPRIEVPFVVDKQIITQSPTVKLVGGGQNYFYATFNICDTWKKVSGIKVVFSRENIVKVISLTKNNDCWECEIPWEVMAEKGVFYVGVFGDDMLLTDTAYVEVSEGCLTDGDEPLEPTPDWFSTMEKTLEDTISEINEINDDIANTNTRLDEMAIYNTASSIAPIYDIEGGDLKSIKDIKFYGYTSQESGAKLSSPKEIECNTPLDKIHCCEYTKSHFKGYLNKSLYATNNYKDYGWVDLNNSKIHYKRFIKRVVLDGRETGSLPIWYKASYPEGRYFANLHRIPGLFTDEDLSRIQKDTPIAYNDAKCSIGSEYYDTEAYGDFQESGQFRLIQGMSNGVGYFRFEFFAPEFDTLNEVLAALKKNPITLFIPMIYEVYEDEFDCDIPDIIKDYGQNPFTLYFEGMTYSYLGDINIYPTEVTYQVDVGLCIQNMKNAIIELGGKI